MKQDSKFIIETSVQRLLQNWSPLTIITTICETAEESELEVHEFTDVAKLTKLFLELDEQEDVKETSSQFQINLFDFKETGTLKPYIRILQELMTVPSSDFDKRLLLSVIRCFIDIESALQVEALRNEETGEDNNQETPLNN